MERVDTDLLFKSRWKGGGIIGKAKQEEKRGIPTSVR